MEDKEEDERREAVIASTPALQSDFTSNGNITPSQLSKFQELHRRRLEIKSKWKFKKKQKETSVSKTLTTKDCDGKGSSGLSSDNNDVEGKETEMRFVPKQRQKLYWGLGPKERWERKANM